MTGMSRTRRCLQSLCLLSLLLSLLLAPCHSSTPIQPYYFSSTQSQLLLDLHNSLRSTVTPPSANMRGLYWDNNLATSAANLAATCPPATSVSDSSSSTNVAYIPPFAADGTQGTIAQLPITNAVSAWTAPAAYYSFNANTCRDTNGCLSWLNLVYAPSYTVGCGLSSQQCSSVPVTFANSSVPVIGGGYAVVCMYAGGGASTASQPYTAGLSCSGCPANFAQCSIPSTCLASSGTCPALCAVSGGLGSGLAGTIIGVVVGFVLLVVLSVYGYSVYWWREHGLYGNVKPTYKYTKAVSKDDDDGNTSKPISAVPLTQIRHEATAEPTSPIPTALPVKTPAASTAAAATATTAAATAVPAAATATPPTKPKPLTTTNAAKSSLATGKPSPTVPTRPPVSPSNIHVSTSAAGLTGTSKGPSSPTSPKGDGALPEGWSLHKDGTGNQYYFNTTTGQSQWSRPSKA